jgi:hypothetical protein
MFEMALEGFEQTLGYQRRLTLGLIDLLKEQGKVAESDTLLRKAAEKYEDASESRREGSPDSL